MEGIGENLMSVPFCGDGYLDVNSYIAFLVKSTKNGQLLKVTVDAYKRAKKYTFVATVLKVVAKAAVLLERSALFLLIFTVTLVILPVILLISASVGVVGMIGFIRLRGEIATWLKDAENITVYIAPGSFFGHAAPRRRKRTASAKGEIEDRPLFARCAILEAGEYTHPVIVVCKDNFRGARWGGANLLTVRLNCFYTVKRHYLDRKNVTYLVLD